MSRLSQYPGNTSTKEGAHHTAMSQIPILNGDLVTVEFDSTDRVTVPHPLGRAYKGGWVVNTDEIVATPAIYIKEPELASRDGIDIKNYVRVGSFTSWSGTVTIWLF